MLIILFAERDAISHWLHIGWNLSKQAGAMMAKWSSVSLPSVGLRHFFHVKLSVFQIVFVFTNTAG